MDIIMTTLKTMYEGVAGSPETIITVQYVAGTSATITVADASVLPAAPNRVVLQRVSDLGFVTVFYGTRVGNVLGVLTPEAGLTTGTFPVGSTAARRFTESDHAELRDNITTLNSDKAELVHADRHKGGGADQIAVATTTVHGLMSSTDKIKLSTVANGAQVNVLEAVKVGGVALPFTGKAVDIPLATSLLDGAMSSEDKVILDGHVANVTTNPHNVTKTNVGLGNCNNTSDANKPVSTAQATAIGLKVDIAQGVSNANKIVVTNPTTGAIETLAKKTAFNSDIATATPLVAGTAAVGVSAKLAKEDHVHPAQTAVSGNAGTATKLATARAIDGVSFDGSASISRYGVCSTARGTAGKVVSLTGYTLVTGAIVVIKFTNGNRAEGPTLNISSTGAKAITYKGSAVSPEQIEVGGIYAFVYDGTNYDLIGNLFDDTSNIEVHGFIVDESDSNPKTCMTYIGSSVGLGLSGRKDKFKAMVPHAVVKAAVRQYYVDEDNWALKSDGITSSGVANGLLLDGNFVNQYPTFWFRVTPLGTDIHMLEFTWDTPPCGNGWVCCHWYNGTIRLYVWVGTFEGIVDGGKLRSVYSDTLTPTVSMTNEAFRDAAQATGAAEGLTGDDNTYTISQGLIYIMRMILMYWTYGTLNLQTDVSRGIVDDTSSVVGKRPVGYGVALTGGYTQGTPASTQAYTDNTSAVVNGEVNPYGNVREHMIDLAYRFGEIAMALDGSDHFNITTLTTENWDDVIPNTWARVYDVGTASGYIRKMLWATQFPFVSISTVGGSSDTYWSDYSSRNAEDAAENKVPRGCFSGGGWTSASIAGPACLSLDNAVGLSGGGIGARLQIFSKEDYV